MIRRPPRSTRTDTLFPYTTLFRSTLDQVRVDHQGGLLRCHAIYLLRHVAVDPNGNIVYRSENILDRGALLSYGASQFGAEPPLHCRAPRSEEHTSELQSLMRISYAVFCLKKKTSISMQRAQYENN